MAGVVRVVRASRRAMRDRSSCAALRLNVRTRISSGRQPAVLDAVDHELDECRGLARAGAREHLQRPAGAEHVLEHGLLAVVEHRRR